MPRRVTRPLIFAPSFFFTVNEYGWWYFNNGVIDFAYTGIGSNEYGQWYFNRGTIDFGYSGTFFADGRQYTIRNGLVIS